MDMSSISTVISDSMILSTFELRRHVLPLPPLFVERILRQQPSALLVRRTNHEDQQILLDLQCDWQLTVAPPSPASSLPSSTSSPSPSPIIPVPQLQLHPHTSFSFEHFHMAITFLIQCFPFDSIQHAVDSITRFAVLWPQLSRKNTSASSEGTPDIRSARLTARLVQRESAASQNMTPALDLVYTAHHEQSRVSLLGRDVNSWGDVDILLEVPSSKKRNSVECNAATQQQKSETDNEKRENQDPANGISADAPSAGLYCLNLLPHQRIPLHIHRVMNESEFIFSHSVHVQHQLAPFGYLHQWLHLPHTYYNPSSLLQRILCIDVPSFIPTDEIIVEDKEKLVRPPQSSLMQQMWKDILNSNVEWTFPGGLDNQRVTLRVDQTAFEKPHAVLLLAFSSSSPSTQIIKSDEPAATEADANSNLLELLFVHHQKRGWELPGGKVDAGETAESAVFRETLEESGYDLSSLGAGALKPIAQYVCEENNDPSTRHIKSVFAVKFDRAACKPQPLKRETIHSQWMVPPSWPLMFDSTPAITDPSSISASAVSQPSSVSQSDAPLRFSSILNDNVFPLCCKFALAALQ